MDGLKAGFSFGHFENKLKADPEKTQAIFPKTQANLFKKHKNLPSENQFFF